MLELNVILTELKIINYLLSQLRIEPHPLRLRFLSTSSSFICSLVSLITTTYQELQKLIIMRCYILNANVYILQFYHGRGLFPTSLSKIYDHVRHVDCVHRVGLHRRHYQQPTA